MIVLRHRCAAGRSRDVWEYDPVRRIVIATFGILELDIPVCHESMPRRGSFAISRRTEGWQLCPSMFYLPDRVWMTKTKPYGEGAPLEFVLLAGAPDGRLLEMEKLVQDRGSPEPGIWEIDLFSRDS